MTTTDPTGAALYRAILADPDDDTPRLVYADWLQEEGDDDRAEFIRVQCRIADINAGIQSAEDCGQPGCAECDERHPAARVLDLLASNRERWLRVECPKCGASGSRDMYDDVGDLRATARCQWCDGTGDVGGLAPWAGPAVGTNAYPYLTVFRKGFPDEVQCRIADVMVWRQDRCEDGSHYPSPRSGWRPHQPCKTCEGSGAVTGWKPTPWIARVFAHHPIRRMPLVDRVPFFDAGHGYGWMRADVFPMSEHADLPAVLFDALTSGDFLRVGRSRTYRTAEDAADALAVATADVCRAHSAPTLRPLNAPPFRSNRLHAKVERNSRIA